MKIIPHGGICQYGGGIFRNDIFHVSSQETKFLKGCDKTYARVFFNIGVYMKWIVFLFVLMTLVALGSCFYLTKRICSFYLLQKLTKSNKKKTVIISLLLEFIPAVIFYFALGLWNMIAIYLHLLIIWTIADLIRFIINKAGVHKSRYNISGAAAIIFTMIYLSAAWYTAHHVEETYYTVDGGLGDSPLRIVAISDSHLSANIHWQDFDRYIDQINALNPDVVAIVGDYVDDATSFEDMENCTAMLADLKTRYGVYFVFGNHEKAYFSGSSRGFNEDTLLDHLQEAGVIILQDETVPLRENVILAGRLDKSRFSRITAEELLHETQDEDFVILLDHQPNDYDAEEAAGADLVLSGHTHGGQFIPITRVGEWAGLNDSTYGLTKRNDTTFIVSSGISCWTFGFKTGCISEIVVVDVK